MKQHVYDAGCQDFSGMISMFLFDILQIASECIQNFNWCIAPTYIPFGMGLVYSYLRPQDKFPRSYKTLNSNICLQSLEFCFTENEVSAYTSSTVFRTSVHTLTSFLLKTRAFNCMKKFSAIWKYITAFKLSIGRNVSLDSVN